MKKGRGRPKGSTTNKTADAVLPMVRVTTDKLEAYKAAAEHSGLTFSAWVREWLDKGLKNT